MDLIPAQPLSSRFRRLFFKVAGTVIQLKIFAIRPDTILLKTAVLLVE